MELGLAEEAIGPLHVHVLSFESHNRLADADSLAQPALLPIAIMGKVYQRIRAVR